MRLALALPLIALTSLVAACKNKPCAVGRYELDTRPLPADWASVMAAPEGAAMCFDNRDVPSRGSGSYHRVWDARAKTGEEAHAKWRAALLAKGWTPTPASRPRGDYDFTPDSCSIADRLDHGELTLYLAIDRCKTFGWTTTNLDRRDLNKKLFVPAKP